MRALKKTRPTPKRPPRGLWSARRRWPVFLFSLSLVGVAAYAVLQTGLAPLSSSGRDAALRTSLQEMGLRVRSITVAGRVHTGAKELLDALNIAKDDSILHVDLESAHKRVAGLPWVEQVSLIRNLPDALHIEIIERVPIAIWQRNGEMVLIDRTGQEITEKNIAEFHALPLIVGKGAPRAAGELIAMLDTEPQLRGRVKAAIRVGERRWNLRFKDGIDVCLPEQDAQAAWRKLALYEAREGLLARDVELVDLRLASKLVVRLTPDAIRRTAEPGRDAHLYDGNFVRGHG
ncbi:MAG: cell division protein FtsQ/DivIB [Pseudomonadota bacterium]